MISTGSVLVIESAFEAVFASAAPSSMVFVVSFVSSFTLPPNKVPAANAATSKIDKILFFIFPPIIIFELTVLS